MTSLAVNAASSQLVLIDMQVKLASAMQVEALQGIAGCVITNTESVVFEFLSNANHAAFKVVSILIK